MRKYILIALLIATAILCGYKFRTQHYELKGVIIEVVAPCNDYPEGFVTFQDQNGNLWSFEGAEDWFEYDLLTAEMCDNGTEWIKDDKIVQLTYTGYINELLIGKMPLKDLIR